MEAPSASVVIPSYNNASTVPKTLLALTQQTLPPNRFEVILVDDGSTDETEKVVRALTLPETFQTIRKSNGGAAAARNCGAAQARGEILVFLDSDVVPDATLLQQHLKSHRVHKRALVVGRSRALPALESDRFYEIMGDNLFSFDEGDAEKMVTFQEVLSRNLSLPRKSFLEIGGFDEGFPRSGYEDIEFAYRATQLGFRVVYNPQAAGDHHHTGTLEEVGQHMYNYQMSAVLLMRKHPEIKGKVRHLKDKEPIQWGRDDLRLVGRKLARQTSSLRPSVWIMRRAITALERWYPSPSLLRMMYWQVLGSYLFSGFRDGLRQYGVSF
jgi:glycosyltransferase involved in cell wall biosynthesis